MPTPVPGTWHRSHNVVEETDKFITISGFWDIRVNESSSATD